MWFEGTAWCTMAWLWTQSIQWRWAFFPFSTRVVVTPNRQTSVPCLFFPAFSCGLASTVMCPIIPLHKQFFKSSGGSLRAVFIFLSTSCLCMWIGAHAWSVLRLLACSNVYSCGSCFCWMWDVFLSQNRRRGNMNEWTEKIKRLFNFPLKQM